MIFCISLLACARFLLAEAAVVYGPNRSGFLGYQLHSAGLAKPSSVVTGSSRFIGHDGPAAVLEDNFLKNPFTRRHGDSGEQGGGLNAEQQPGQENQGWNVQRQQDQTHSEETGGQNHPSGARERNCTINGSSIGQSDDELSGYQNQGNNSGSKSHKTITSTIATATVTIDGASDSSGLFSTPAAGATTTVIVVLSFVGGSSTPPTTEPGAAAAQTSSVSVYSISVRRSESDAGSVPPESHAQASTLLPIPLYSISSSSKTVASPPPESTPLPAVGATSSPSVILITNVQGTPTSVLATVASELVISASTDASSSSSLSSTSISYSGRPIPSVHSAVASDSTTAAPTATAISVDPDLLSSTIIFNLGDD